MRTWELLRIFTIHKHCWTQPTGVITNRVVIFQFRIDEVRATLIVLNKFIGLVCVLWQLKVVWNFTLIACILRLRQLGRFSNHTCLIILQFFSFVVSYLCLAWRISSVTFLVPYLRRSHRIPLTRRSYRFNNWIFPQISISISFCLRFFGCLKSLGSLLWFYHLIFCGFISYFAVRSRNLLYFWV